MVVPVEQGDVKSFASTIERVMRQVEEEPRIVQSLGLRAATFVRENYAPARERDDLLSFFSSVQ